LKHWQEDTDLSGVRDKAAQEKLPEAERDAWRKLWQYVEAIKKDFQEYHILFCGNVGLSKRNAEATGYTRRGRI
jgi:hypothetical protein